MCNGMFFVGLVVVTTVGVMGFAAIANTIAINSKKKRKPTLEEVLGFASSKDEEEPPELTVRSKRKPKSVTIQAKRDVNIELHDVMEKINKHYNLK